jgi:outer membrane protein TolC
MPQLRVTTCLAALWLAAPLMGCALVHRPGSQVPSTQVTAGPTPEPEDPEISQPVSFQADMGLGGVGDTAATNPSPDSESPSFSQSEPADALLTLDEVVHSVYASYPLLESALYARDVAHGEHLAAHGQFDLKLKGASENGPVGFYETYRQTLGLVQPLYSGCDIWGRYRIGRGNIQPWYRERQTNDGGELRAGVTVPLLRDRRIDERRAELWRTGLGPRLAEFDIRAQLIGFVQEASHSYWDWVGAGQAYKLAERVLDLADSRTDRIKRQVETGLIDPPELTDNLRLVANRRAILAKARRMLDQKAAKLSLYLRNSQGQPVVPGPERLPSFPEPTWVDPSRLADDVQVALGSRPELGLLDTIRRQREVDLAQARNELRPEVDAFVWGSQDVGAPASSKRDKSPFELEAGLYVDVPLQRRKARGKIASTEAKIHQIAAKRRMMEDKITVDVQTAYAALAGAFEQFQQTRDAVRLAAELAQRERRNFELGASDLLRVTLREQYAAEAEVEQINALLQYHGAQADYRAALAEDPTQ